MKTDAYGKGHMAFPDIAMSLGVEPDYLCEALRLDARTLAGKLTADLSRPGTGDNALKPGKREAVRILTFLRKEREDPHWYSTGMLAKAAGMTRARVLYHAYKGALTPHRCKDGSSYRFKADEAKAFLKNRAR